MKKIALVFLVVWFAACGSDNNDNNSNNTNNANNANNLNNSNNQTNNANNTTGGVPTSSDPIFTYLKDGQYTGWSAESSGIHASTGPHFGDVLTFVNAELEASLKSGATDHPAGSAAIKEFYGDDQVLDGWAAMVKLSTGSEGDAWYWYETTNTDTNSPLVEGVGNGTCTGCHSAGVDFVRTMSDAF